MSVVLFGSGARGEAHGGSDIDLLVVAEDFPEPPRTPADPARCLVARPVGAWAPDAEWNLVTKTRPEAREHSPLYLDMVEDAILLATATVFSTSVLRAMRERMQALGSQRVFLEDGSWYRDLDPGLRFGDVVEI